MGTAAFGQKAGAGANTIVTGRLQLLSDFSRLPIRNRGIQSQRPRRPTAWVGRCAESERKSDSSSMN